MRKLIEHTYGSHIYMKLELNSGKVAEIDHYLHKDGTSSYKTTGDYNEVLRNEIIDTYNKLY